MKKIGIFLLLIIFVGTINVKAMEIGSLNNTGFAVTIEKFQINLYDIPAEGENNAPLFNNPITFEIPASDIDLHFANNRLKSKQVNIEDDQKLDMSIVELVNSENNFSFNKETLGGYLDVWSRQEENSFDTSKQYYGDIEVVYSVTEFPNNFKAFTQVNTIRSLLVEIPAMFAEMANGENSGADNAVNLSKPAYETKNLVAGTPIQTTQMLNLFTFNEGGNDSENASSIADKIDIVTDVGNNDSGAGLYTLNYGIFSEKENFDINKVSSSDKAIMFSIVSGVDTFIDNLNSSSLVNYEEAYVADNVSNDDAKGVDVVRVGNTAATQNEIAILVGLILLFSGLLLISKIMTKRYN